MLHRDYERFPIRNIDRENIIERDTSPDFPDRDKMPDREPTSRSKSNSSRSNDNQRRVTLGVCLDEGREIVYHIAFKYQKTYCGHTVFEVALHEVFHWFQLELANAIVRVGSKADIVEKELKAYKYRYNLDHYIAPWEGFYKYCDQLVERDANWFADYVYSIKQTNKTSQQQSNKRRAAINEINKLKGQILHRKEIYEKLEIAIPNFKRSSFQLTDYCYNRINAPIKNNILQGKKAVFLFELQPDGNYYKVLGEKHPYSGEIFEKPTGSDEVQVVKEFRWDDGKIISNASGAVLFE